MSVVHLTELGNPSSTDLQDIRTPEEIAAKLDELSHGMRDLVKNAVAQRESFDSTERKVWETVLKTGFEAMQLFVGLQGKGDLGEEVTTEEGKTLQRSSEPVKSIIRSIFGEHSFEQYAYSPGKNKKIELYTISARMELPRNRWSYLLEEFSQMFDVDQAFKQAADNLEAVLGTKFSVDTLEQTSQRIGVEADAFLDQLPTPKKKDEGGLLIASADCKGVPLVKEDAAQVAAFETAKKRPGNRRMATVTSVYSVEPHVRTAEQIVEALFRDKDRSKTQSRSKKKRPRPQHKHTAAHFPTMFQDGDMDVPITGIQEGMAWLARQVHSRRGKQQPLMLLMDGQESLWEVANLHFHDDPLVVEGLDIIHVSTYVWEASSLFHSSKEMREAFTRERLLRILKGEVKGVIRGLRRMGSLHKLQGERLQDLERICGYFEKHQHRMRYDEYLAAGYPVASGVVEGACGYLVKDRMERSGMRWTLEGARAMLNMRAVFQSDYWDTFCQQRVTTLTEIAHPNRNLVDDYTPLSLAG